MYCEHCGKLISGEAKFCNACGKQIQAPLQTPPSVGRKKRTWWKWTLGIFVGLVILGGLLRDPELEEEKLKDAIPRSEEHYKQESAEAHYKQEAGDVSYEIINASRVPGLKCSLDVRLSPVARM